MDNFNYNHNIMSSGGGSQKTKKKTKGKSKRNRRINSERTMECREEELPWAAPLSGSALTLLNLINADIRKTQFLETSAVASGSYVSAVLPNNDNPDDSMERINHKLDRLLGSKSRNMTTTHQGIPQNILRPVHNFSGPVPIPTASSDEFMTIFSNKCAVPSNSGGRVVLPPIGVFWDIENCSIPKGRSALVAVQRIRDRFFQGHYEAEFVCVCDIRKESPGVIQELNDAQITVVHVSGNSKNAADDKLRQAMRRYADVYSSYPVCPTSPHPATIILISGDINFSSDLSDLRHRKRLYVILLHNKHAPEALLLCGHERYDFHTLLGNLPPRPMLRDCMDANNQIPLKGGLLPIEVLVCDLPCVNSKTQICIKNRLKKLSENCGGKVVNLQGQLALVRFPNKEAALRATKRMNGEDVLGSKIRVLYHSQMEFQQGRIGTAPVQAHQNQTRNRDSSLGPSSTWKPSWKSKTALITPSAESTGSPIRPLNSSRSCSNQQVTPTAHAIKSQVSYHHNTTATPGSNSTSSPFDSSREPSPSCNMKCGIETLQSVPLNNSAHPNQLHQTMACSPLNTTSSTAPFAFHQNLYSLSQTGILENNLGQTQQQPQNDFTAIMTPPRFYSSPFAAVSSGENIPPTTSDLNAGQDGQSTSSSTSNSNAALGPHLNGVYGLGTNGIETPSRNNGSPMNTMKSKPSDSVGHFDLHVTNIDPSLGDWKIIRHTLMTAFGEHMGVKATWVYISQDGSVSAVVRVSNKDEAHYAVSQLHRKKLGNKRIFISFDEGGNVNQDILKNEVASLLQDVPGAALPLFKFREMFEKRYRRTVSSAELYRLRDVVAISENNLNNNGSGAGYQIGRTISLSSEWKIKDDKNVSLYCSLHPPKKQISNDRIRTGWAEKEAEISLPNVIVELKVLGERVHALLNSHAGSFPLISFMDCYETEFALMERAEEGSGVPLEHLLSCIQGVEISVGDNGMKQIKWSEKKELDAAGFVTQPLAVQLAQFGREMIDLLKTFSRCSLAFSKLIPAYHHHFGRQCRVADYGHFNLQSLLHTLPHVVQIMGSGQNRILTLSHKAQMKRFATDLLRVLKAHGGAKKQIKVEDFPQIFSQIFIGRQFNPEDYGLCFFTDLISALVENSTLVALVKDEDGNQMLAVPKREQTPQEIHRTRIFATEVIELLRHSIRYEMPFSKFIPSYHHHFGKQCRVSDYGFSKLAELFEAISDTIVCFAPNMPSSSMEFNIEDKLIRLVPQEQIKVVGEQLSKLLENKAAAGKQVLLEEVDDLFLEEYGFQLRPEACEAESIEDLVQNKLYFYLKVQERLVTAVDRNEIELLSHDISTILEKHPKYKMDLKEFLKSFKEIYGIELDIGTMEKNLTHFLVLSDAADEDGNRTVELTPLKIFSREIVQLLEETGSGSLMLSSVESSYLQKFGQPLRPAQMGFPSLIALLQAIPDVIQVQGKHRAKRVALAGLPMSDTSSLDESYRSQKSRQNESFNSGKSFGYSYHQSNKPYSAERPSPRYSNLLKQESRRWSDSPKQTRKAIPPPLFTPSMGSPGFHGRPAQQEGSVFTFDRSAPLSPPVYDLWMRGESMSPGTPLCSPPVVWTYHPIVYPPTTPPANTGSIMMPAHFSYTGPWSPPIASACYDRMAPQTGNVMGSEFIFADQQTRLSHGIERLNLGMEPGRNEA